MTPSSWPFDPLRPLTYRVIVADPPWSFETYSEKGQGRSAQAHYQCMTLADIKALPVHQLAAPDALLWLWCTWPMLVDGLRTLAAWGFTYKTGGAWVKQTKGGGKLAFGTGYILRGASEPFLIGTIGKPAIRSRSERNAILAPVREHSRKPDDAYALLGRLLDGPRADLFSRETRPGWDAWGAEVGKFDAPRVGAGAG